MLNINVKVFNNKINNLNKEIIIIPFKIINNERILETIIVSFNIRY